MEESSTILGEKLVVRQLLFLGSHEIDLHSLNRACDASFCQGDTAASKQLLKPLALSHALGQVLIIEARKADH